jgi:2-methylaconitate cis-trans-isomerase PrpF
MKLHRIPAVYMRGGTSRAVMFKESDLPPGRAERDALFLAVMGAPDPSARNLDGMGGGLSSLNKVCVVGPPSRADADVDYTFVQLEAATDTVDYGGNCGNMSSAIGPFAIEEGLVPSPAEGEAVVRIHNTNTGKIIVARFPVVDGMLAPDGALALDGVAGTAAPIRLEFLSPGGAKTGRLLPTGHAVDVLDLPGFGPIEASCIDAANPCVFVRATDVGKSGTELPTELERDIAWLERMEAIRRAASVAMGLAADREAAAKLASVPKVAMVCPPADARTLTGATLEAGAADITVRMISVGQPHRAVPITGSICLAVATRVPGSIPASICAAAEGPTRIGHPSGTTLVDADVAVDGNGQAVAKLGAVYRTARRLFEGNAVYRL